MTNCFKFAKNVLTMDTNETIEHTLEVMKHLPEEEQKKVSDFAEKILTEMEDRMMTKGMMQLAAMSPRTWEFLNDGEVYTEKDAIGRYEH